MSIVPRPPLASLRYGVAFLVLASFLVWRSSLGHWRFLLLWPALSFAVISAGYFGLGARVVGKRSAGRGRGSVGIVSAFVHLPYFALVRVVWHALRIVRKAKPYHQVWPDVVVGRRLMSSERIEDIERVIDLTCEMEEPQEIQRGVEYWPFPTLDQTPPAAPVLLDIARQMATPGPRTYVHCAEGHGRAGTVAVCLALVRGEADTVEEAIAWMKSQRPGTRLSTAQQRRVHALLPSLLELRPRGN